MLTCVCTAVHSSALPIVTDFIMKTKDKPIYSAVKYQVYLIRIPQSYYQSKTSLNQ